LTSQVLTEQGSVAVGAFVGLLRAHAALTRRLNASLLEDHGLTINDYEALLLISRADEQRMRRVDLAAGLLLTASGVTRLLEGLEAAGLVAREACASDRRVVYAVLTDDGRERLEAASRSHLTQLGALLESRLDPTELSRLSELLDRLAAVDGAAAADCGS
jgi:DNA-binding MarR family transcriptional regulator